MTSGSRTALRIVIFLIVAGALVLPGFSKGYTVFLLSTIGIYAIVTLGLNILVGASGQLSIGHAAFFAIGAYSVTILMLRLNMPYVPAMFLAAVITAFCGLIVGIPSTKLKGPYLAIATLGFGMLIQPLIREWESITGGRNGLSVPSITIGSLQVDSDGRIYWFVMVITVLCMLVIRNILRSRIGLAWRALRDAEIAAQAVGIRVSWHKATAFAASAFFTGLAGALYAPFISYINYESFGLLMSISFLSGVILGGLGSIAGSLLGAAYLTLAPEIFRGLEQMQMIAYGLMMILVIRFMKGGLMEIPLFLKRVLLDRFKLSPVERPGGEKD
jgi:branched-chain amino acid transport system permease protein